jgi:catalase
MEFAARLDATPAETFRDKLAQEPFQVVDTNDKDAFIAAAKTRQWDREKSVRIQA